jgi:hypothetical protein
MIGSKGLDEGVDLWNGLGLFGSTCVNMIFSCTFWWTLVVALYILPANMLDYR